MYQYYRYKQNPVGSYQFYVEIGNRQIGFQKVSGIDLVNQTPFVSSSEILGKNEPQYASASLRGTEEENIQSTQQQRERTLTLEKAVLTGSFLSSTKEEQAYLFSLLEEGVRIEKITIWVPAGGTSLNSLLPAGMSLNSLLPAGMPLRSMLTGLGGMTLNFSVLCLNFTDCYLTSYTLSDLDATRTDYIRQTLQFSYRNVTIDW